MPLVQVFKFGLGCCGCGGSPPPPPCGSDCCSNCDFGTRFSTLFVTDDFQTVPCTYNPLTFLWKGCYLLTSVTPTFDPCGNPGSGTFVSYFVACNPSPSLFSVTRTWCVLGDFSAYCTDNDINFTTCVPTSTGCGQTCNCVIGGDGDSIPLTSCSPFPLSITLTNSGVGALPSPFTAGVTLDS
jgi:hypothetical protein